MASTPATQVSDWFKNWIGTHEAPEAPASNVTPLPRPAGADITAYANAALLSELDKLRATGEGSRNHQLNVAAFNMGQLVAGGEAEAHYVADMLAAAARDIGLDPREIMATLRSGMNSGAKEPRIAPPLEPGYTEVSADEITGSFWQQRDVLAHIQEFAYARMVAPWSVLGVCVLRALAVIPPHVVLPPLIGGVGALNLFVALVSPSGYGKGATEAAARDAIDFIDPIHAATVGSGEGIAHQYAHRDRNGVTRDRDSVLFSVPEVDTMTALGSRQGSTLLSQLRSAFSGETLGFSYADATRRIPLEGHTYRLGMVVGVQPEKAGPIIYDADGGTPQRFVWLPATDKTITTNPPTEPPQWVIDKQSFYPTSTHDMKHVLSVPDVVRQTILEAHVQKHQGASEALDGHALFVREKVAQALTFLDRRRVMNEEDWELSGVIMAVSDATRAHVQAMLQQRQVTADRARAEREAHRTLIVTERLADATATRVSARLLKHVPEEGVAWHALRKKLASNERKHFDEAIERLVKAGQVGVEGDESSRRIVLTKVSAARHG